MKIENICKTYKNKVVLDDVSIELKEGQCIGILGANGSGKSTLLSVLSGVSRADSGSFFVDGADLLADEKKRRELISFVPQKDVLYEELSGWDNLKLWYDKASLDRSLNEGLLKKLGVETFLDKKVRTLSGGMKKRLSLSCCMSGNPRILLLDEPTVALDFETKDFIDSYIKSFVSKGNTVILTTHEKSQMELFDSVYILSDGKLTLYEKD